MKNFHPEEFKRKQTTNEYPRAARTARIDQPLFNSHQLYQHPIYFPYPQFQQNPIPQIHLFQQRPIPLIDIDAPSRGDIVPQTQPQQVNTSQGSDKVHERFLQIDEQCCMWQDHGECSKP